MDIHPQLLIISVGYVFSILITLGFGIFVLFSNAPKETRVSFFLMALAVSIFEISFLFGVNVKDSALSRRIFMFNLTDIFIVIFNAHWILSALGIRAEEKKRLGVITAAGVALFFFFLLYPERFLHASIPKMYFPNYYVGGDLYILMVLFFFSVLGYIYYHLFRAYAAADLATKNRIKYFISAMTVGYGLGSTAFLLVFDVPVNPILSLFTGFYTIPLAYGIVKHQLMDIQVVVKKAFFYSIAIAVISGAIVGITLLNDWFVQNIRGFRFWFIPLMAGIVSFR